MSDLLYLDLDRRAYKPTLDLQLRLHEEVRSSDRELAYLLLIEHDRPVITLGRSAKAEHIITSRKILKAEGIGVYHADRGGDVTYHGPGQLVGYPIIRLDLHGRSIHGYMRNLEEVIIRVLARFDIIAERVPGLTGVWIGEEKIAAIGVAVRRWITYHGFALNVLPNLSHFDLIVPCGISDKRVTSMERLLDRPVSIEEVKPVLIQCMIDVFGFDSAVHAKTENELFREE